MIKIICIGKIKEKYLNDLIKDYYQRISKYHKIQIIELKDNNNIHKETEELKKVIDKKDYNIALTIEGTKYNSIELAKKINKIFSFNSNISFLIGGSNGLEKEIIEICQEQISFSDLTFPHGLFRGILLEQIYRTFKINNNEKYHK